ncbi:MAG: M50 family metallopeptidase [Clostridia bacterium]|nr:M50 family metallopeptidase [Clostridia bacterium]
MSRVKKKEKGLLFWLVILLSVGIGFLVGFTMVEYLEQETAPYAIVGFLLAALAAFYLQLILHEAGHLVFGLLSGYRFQSFRIGSLMLLKRRGKLHLTFYSLAGTAGQCLMSPPEMKEGKLPVVLYNLGGVLMNLLVGAVCLILWFFSSGPLAAFLYMMAVFSLLMLLTNGIPMRVDGVDNDGQNVVSLRKNYPARRAFWIQLKISEMQAEGVAPRQMPAEWFEFPQDGELQNGLTATLGVFACNRLLDEERLKEAEEQMRRLLQKRTALAGVYRNLLTCDLIFCQLMLHGDTTPLDRKLQQFMRAMQKNPGVLRTRYAYAMIAEKDGEKAAKLKAQFDRLAGRYPYTAELKGEARFMKMIEEKCNVLETK